MAVLASSRENRTDDNTKKKRISVSQNMDSSNNDDKSSEEIENVQSRDSVIEIEYRVCDVSKLSISTVSNSAILLTFGIVSPLLAFVIVCSVVLSNLYSQLTIAYCFVKAVDRVNDATATNKEASTADVSINNKNTTNNLDTNSNSDINVNSKINIDSEAFASSLKRDYLLQALERDCLEFGSTIITDTFWVTQILSSVFLALFSFDIVGDAVGFKKALWAPIVLVSTVVGFNLAALVWTNAHDTQAGQAGQARQMGVLAAVAAGMTAALRRLRGMLMNLFMKNKYAVANDNRVLPFDSPIEEGDA